MNYEMTFASEAERAESFAAMRFQWVPRQTTATYAAHNYDDEGRGTFIVARRKYGEPLTFLCHEMVKRPDRQGVRI